MTADADAPASPERAGESSLALFHRGLTATRVLLIRGFLLRIVSFTTNLALVALVQPRDFGLLAVVRSTLGLAEFASELGFQMAMIRRQESPTRQELAGLSGFRLLVLLVVVALSVVLPGARTVFGLVPADLGGWMLLALGSLLLTPTQSACKILLERDLQFTRLSVIEVNGVLLQNVGLILFALGHHFEAGIFCVPAVLSLYYTLALQRARPAWALSFNFAALRKMAGASASFSLAALTSVLRESLTSLIIAKVFGLAGAGVWAFAVRTRQFLQVTIEAYGRAGMAVAGRLRESPSLMRRFATQVLHEAAALMFPVTVAAYALLPLVGIWFPKWVSAIPVAQLYLVLFTTLGVVQVSLWPSAVARIGPKALLIAELLSLGTAWLGLGVLAATGWNNLALPLGLAWAPSVIYLYYALAPEERPALRAALAGPSVLLAAGLGVAHWAQTSWLSPVLRSGVGAVVPAILLTITLSRRGRWGLPTPETGWEPT